MSKALRFLSLTLLACASVAGTANLQAQDATAPPPVPPSSQMPPDHQGPPPADGGGRGGRGGYGGGQMQERQLEMMTKQLKLTDAQVTQIKAIDADAMQQSMAVRKDSSVAQADKRGKNMAIREAAMAKIRATLTDGQKPKYDAMVERQKERREAGGGRGPGGPPPPPPPPQ